MLDSTEEELTTKQIELVKEKLNSVFEHVIDPSIATGKALEDLREVHSGEETTIHNAPKFLDQKQYPNKQDTEQFNPLAPFDIHNTKITC